MKPKMDPPEAGSWVLVSSTGAFEAKAAIVLDLRIQHRKIQSEAVRVAEELREAEDDLAAYVREATRA